MNNTEIIPGLYRHYKNKDYQVLGTAFHSENEEEFVIYKALYECENYPKETLWIRPKKMFLENVLVDGILIPRFKKV